MMSGDLLEKPNTDYSSAEESDVIPANEEQFNLEQYMSDHQEAKKLLQDTKEPLKNKKYYDKLDSWISTSWGLNALALDIAKKENIESLIAFIDDLYDSLSKRNKEDFLENFNVLQTTIRIVYLILPLEGQNILKNLFSSYFADLKLGSNGSGEYSRKFYDC